MDSPDIPSPKPELQLNGPRPSPLRVRKASHKIRKSPVAPPPAGEAHRPPPPPPPVIIYTESPKIIHVGPDEFKSVVQQLTGPNTWPPSAAFQENGGGVFPAAPSWQMSSLPQFPQNSFPMSSENSLIRPNYFITSGMNVSTSSPKNEDIFSILFDL
ncbi:hypothetical protein ACS0TY_035835 [Phlomoides rotata]